MSEFLQKTLTNQSLNKQIYEVLIMANYNNTGTEVPESTGSSPRQGRSGKTPEYRLLTAVTSGLSVLLLGALIYVAAIAATPLVTWSNFFAWFLLGHGALLALKYFANLMTPSPVQGKHGYLIGGGITAGIGALFLAGFGGYFWPVVITGFGIYIVSMGVLKYYHGNGHSI